MKTQRFKITEQTQKIQNPVYGINTITEFIVTRTAEAQDLEPNGNYKYTQELIDKRIKEGVGNFGTFTNKKLAETLANALNAMTKEAQDKIITQTENN